MDIHVILQQLTREEKAALVAGTDFMYTNPVPRLAIPSVRMSDGPHGLRKQAGPADNLGLNESIPATCFPTACATACCVSEICSVMYIVPFLSCQASSAGSLAGFFSHG